MASELNVFLFTDLVGSTDLLSRLGQDAMERLRKTHFAVVRAALASHHGGEVKTLGDAFMAHIPSCDKITRHLSRHSHSAATEPAQRRALRSSAC